MLPPRLDVSGYSSMGGGAEIKGRVLIIEDDASMREMMAEMLSFVGYEVATEDSGSHAIEMAEVWQPCVMILDLMMPGIDGMMIMRELRKRDAPVKILVTTAYMPEDVIDDEGRLFATRENFQMLGAWDLLTKPFEMMALVDLVEEACNEVKRD